MHLDRRKFCTLLGLMLLLPRFSLAEPREIAMEILHTGKPQGGVPNNRLPVIIYHHVIPPGAADSASYLEHIFQSNGWPPQWRYTVYPYTHFHSNTHEALGVSAGSAKLQLGGENGKIINVQVGDVLVIPAGVGHKQISADDDFMMVGAYPDKTKADLCHDEPAKLALRLSAVSKVPLPISDPVTGHSEGLMREWRKTGK
ncbi:cupin domain-containing protein [Rouxiella sp. Mn2063]|uniref:cupin domain-containing protein n=1 Tax=Rouxiella sp. Mn2063 TaxID=3395262 RepID=UPI003BBD03B6